MNAQQEAAQARTIVQKVQFQAQETVIKRNEDFQQAAQIYQGEMNEMVETQAAALQENHLYEKEQALALVRENISKLRKL